ncbi:MAG: TIGR03960 family B12-binding radical SAM protein [Anaerolineae bacterium]|nr:TIGR03960 family B12-binding radical SAM protein [Anaerolineae bacterium]NIN93782.1 TIGR03960 family B12-binding radical SAM protein [Anaerolineae bacterium]NIQ76817.1 TIGR03960 family B12-binding radical SAM protein [Anaerolineae bacterium]
MIEDSVHLDPVLRTVIKPARYTGGEWNSVVKAWDEIEIKLALAYPDVYEVGMSNLAIMILYDLLNREHDVLAERVYTPWVDMEEAMRAAGISLYSLETRHPLAEFDIIGFTLPYELNYTNVLTMLDLGGIPLLARERAESDPLVIGGGGGTYNPEPLADFFDLFVIGEGEEIILELLNLYRESRADREELLNGAAEIEGIYVPSLYDVQCERDGTVQTVRPTHPSAKPTVTKRVVAALPPAPTRVVVPYVEAIHDRAMIEIQRGCTQGCRFCQAGMIYRPLRERPLDEIVTAAEKILAATGYEELALVSLSSCNYSRIEELVRTLLDKHGPNHTSLSLPSLRMDSFSLKLAEMFQGQRKTGLTFAPEAGSERLRRVINKAISDEDILRTAEAAFTSGWHRVKLYFMIGLPTETMEDVEAIASVVKQVHKIGRRERGKRAHVSVSVATFIPKPHTPFQWRPVEDKTVLEQKHHLLRRLIRGRGLKLSWNDPETSILESAISLGDRRLGKVLHQAWREGARFDAWSELFDARLWWSAFEAQGLDPAFYTLRERPLDEALPWDHISSGVSKEFLISEYDRSLREELTLDCREGPCRTCGILATFSPDAETTRLGSWGCPAAPPQ